MSCICVRNIESEGDSLSVKKIPGSKVRKYYILTRLLNDEHLSYQRLADDYFVSRSSIANDIAFIKRLLAKDNVPLVFDNSGTYIGGGEGNKHKILKRTIDGLMRNSEPNTHLLKVFINPTLLETIRKTFETKIQQWSLEVPENYLKDIVVSTSIVVQRGNSHHPIKQTKKNQFGKLLFQLEKYPLVYELLMTVEEKKIYRFSQDELRYLSYVILGNGFKYFMQDATIPDAFKQKVKTLIANVGEGLDIDLTQDARLETDILFHLYQMILRLQSDTTVINPLLDEIKRNYPHIFGVVWYALSEFGNDNILTIPDDEVAFITIHFQAAVERSKSIKRILFVCPNGVGTSSLISAKMRQILPEVSIIEVVSRTDLAKQDLSDVDLIISTVPLTNVSVPVAKISPLLTSKDMKTIMNQYIDLVMINDAENSINGRELKQTFAMLRGHVFFANLKNRHEVIDYLLKTNNWPSKDSLVTYRHSIYTREQLQSTYLGNGFVIPHGDPKKVINSCISILLLDKPIEWGNNKADIISLLMVREEDKKTVEPFMNLIMQGINNKDWFISKIMEVK